MIPPISHEDMSCAPSKTVHIEESRLLGKSVGDDLLKQAGNSYKKKF